VPPVPLSVNKHVQIDQLLLGQCTQLVNADGGVFQPLGISPMTVTFGETHIQSNYRCLILGCNFLPQCGLILDIQARFPRFQAEVNKIEICGLLVMDDKLFSIRALSQACHLDLPSNVHSVHTSTADEYSMLFSK